MKFSRVMIATACVVFFSSVSQISAADVSVISSVLASEYPVEAFTKRGSDTPNYYKLQQELNWPTPSTAQVPVVAQVLLPPGTADQLLITDAAGVAQPYQRRSVRAENTARATFQGVAAPSVTDDNANTSLDIAVNDQFGTYYSRIQLELAQPTRISGVSFSFDALSASPQYVDIVADPGTSSERVVSNRVRYTPQTRFPSQEVSELEITLQHTQPLRLQELQAIAAMVTASESEVRFLAQPNQRYILYSDRAAQAPTVLEQEAGNLFSREIDVTLVASTARPNEQFVSGDLDGDGMTDERDNCPAVSNPDQFDANQNAMGDACEDFDADGVMNAQDNCPEHANRAQEDEDGDGVGDVCDNLESRMTEQYPWLPWAALGFTGVIIAGLFATALRTHTWTDQVPPPQV